MSSLKLTSFSEMCESYNFSLKLCNSKPYFEIHLATEYFGS